MPPWLASVRIDSPWWLAAAAAVALLAFALTIRLRRRRAARSRPGTATGGAAPQRADGARLALLAAASAAAAGIVAALVFWLLIDVVNVFGIPVGLRSRLVWIAGFALIGAAVAVAVAPGPPRRRSSGAFAAVSAVASLLSIALAVNLDAGAVHALGDLVPRPPAATFSPPTATGARTGPVVRESEWRPPAGMPAAGELVEATIPATASGFPARPAMIWLPPAARVANPPTLPVIVTLSGQPGGPGDLYTSGQFRNLLEEHAAAHNGLAPIVVAVDQLGTPEANPLCADGPLGNSRTYLEQDAPAWIAANLPVAAERTAWSLVGFSQGGTCAYQIGLDQPQRYGTVVAIGAERTPTLGSEEATIERGFGGDRAAYERAAPEGVLRAHAPYADTTLYHSVGETDSLFAGYADALVRAAQDAGVTVHRLTSPGTGHDFRTVAWTLRTVLPDLVARSGMVTA